MITYIDGTWFPPLATDIMTDIAQMVNIAGTVRTVTGKLREDEKIRAEDLIMIIDEYDDLKGDVNIYIYLQWEKYVRKRMPKK